MTEQWLWFLLYFTQKWVFRVNYILFLFREVISNVYLARKSFGYCQTSQCFNHLSSKFMDLTCTCTWNICITFFQNIFEVPCGWYFISRFAWGQAKFKCGGFDNAQIVHVFSGVICMFFGYFYMLLSNNCIKVCLQAFVAKNRKKEEKVKKMKEMSFSSRDSIRSSISQRRIQVFIIPKNVDKE
jgi:hypothetical protein